MKTLDLKFYLPDPLAADYHLLYTESYFFSWRYNPHWGLYFTAL